MPKPRVGAVLLWSLFPAGLALAQSPPPPSALHRLLDVFVGRWRFEARMMGNPFGFHADGRYTGTETCEWFSGGFHLICHSEGVGPTGRMEQMGIWAVDLESRDPFTYYIVDSTGATLLWKGGQTGDGRWMLGEGNKVQSRLTITPVSSDVFRYEWIVFDGRKEYTILEGTQTRAR